MSRLGHPSLPPKPGLPPGLPNQSAGPASSSTSPRVIMQSSQLLSTTTTVAPGDRSLLDDHELTTPLVSQSSSQRVMIESEGTPNPCLSQSETLSSSSRSQPSTSQKSHPLPRKPDTSTKRKLEVTEFPHIYDRSVSKPKLDIASFRPESLPTPSQIENSSETEAQTAKAKVIPILPTPLPSRRFKKGQTKSLLIPVEQLPVYALPPLPLITDPMLETTVFQHQSMFPRTRNRFEDTAMHYEKLEHVGDSILGMIVTTWLQETKPNLTCGTASVSYENHPSVIPADHTETEVTPGIQCDPLAHFRTVQSSRQAQGRPESASSPSSPNRCPSGYSGSLHCWCISLLPGRQEVDGGYTYPQRLAQRDV